MIQEDKVQVALEIDCANGNPDNQNYFRTVTLFLGYFCGNFYVIIIKG